MKHAKAALVLALAALATSACGNAVPESQLAGGAASTSAEEARAAPVAQTLSEDPPLPDELARIDGGGWSGLRPAAAPAGAVYACPMHPDVVAGREGKCPRCGMALVRQR
jgi:hypothetical protein